MLYRDGTIVPHIISTASAMIFGFGIACILGVVAGSLVSEFPVIDRAIYPFIVAFQSMPKVALAPILLIWFGFGLTSKIALVALICFFPMFVNIIVGLRRTSPDLIDLYRACSASRFHIFFNVKLPSALGSIFAGLQVALVLSLLGAVTGEFIGSNRGLGYLIQASAINFDMARMFACIVTLQAIGLSASMLIRFLHGRIVFWEGGLKAIREAAPAH
jgi:NitT/TauT family transport system permease protein